MTERCNFIDVRELVVVTKAMGGITIDFVEAMHDFRDQSDTRNISGRWVVIVV